LDQAIRNYERALEGGDEQARLPLASAYQRLGLTADALKVLAGAARLDAPSQALLEETWRGELSRLAPAERVDGARPYGELWGWAGEGAILLASYLERSSGLLGVASFASRSFRYEVSPTGPASPAPVAAAPDELLLPGPPGVLDRLDLRSGALRSQRIAVGGQVMELDPRRERALLRYLEPRRRVVVGVLRLDDGAELFHLNGGPKLKVVVHWRGGWIAWRDERQPLRWAPLSAGEDFLAAEAPTISGRRGHLTPVATVGEYLLAREAAGGVLVDPERGERHELRELPGSAHGPWRLSRDHTTLLGFRVGVPTAFPLAGGPVRQLALPGGPGLSRAAWHPVLDLVALGRRGQGGELRSLSGEVWLHLPRDAHPLGWDPEGRSLVVVRQLGSVGGLLERWTPGGTP
jgi:hypothetical protein